MPNTVTQIKRFIGFVQLSRCFIPNLGQNLVFLQTITKRKLFYYNR